MTSTSRPDSLRARLAQAAPLVTSIAFGAIAFVQSSNAEAHITLTKPTSWVVEDDRGGPQKAGPCGVGPTDAMTPTNEVTQFEAGQEITVEWKETVGHPGHFRIALAKDRADLLDPIVTTTTGDGKTGDSISAEIMNPVAYPVLLDGLYPRPDVAPQAPQVEPFVQKVTLPNEACEDCTLQVIQFMSKHAPGYMYYHCADVNVVAKAAPSTTTSALTPSTSDANADDSGCSIGTGNAAGSQSNWSALGVIGLGAVLWQRRSRRA